MLFIILFEMYILFLGLDPLTQSSSHRMSALTSAEGAANCIQCRSAHTRALRLETGYFEGDPVSVVLLKPITGISFRI